MRYLDALLARVGAQLEHLGIADNTIIFFMGDNGTAVIDKGHYDRDVALRVPFVVSGGPVKPMGEVTTPIDFTDIWPTVADLIGYTGTRNTDGYSFAPLLLGKPFKPRGFARMAMNNARWVRTEDWLLDGYGRLYKVTGARTRKDYRDMTGSDDPEAVAAYSKLRALAEKHLLLPNYNDPLTRDAWQWFHKHGGMPVKVIKAEAP
jgi:arylsulfatase A-like enzyme